MAREVSELFDASEWTDAASGVAGQRRGAGFTDITYHHSNAMRAMRPSFEW